MSLMAGAILFVLSARWGRRLLPVEILIGARVIDAGSNGRDCVLYPRCSSGSEMVANSRYVADGDVGHW